MQPTDLLASLMNLNGGVAAPAGQPLQPQENPMAGLAGLPAGTSAPVTAPPDVTANLSPGRQVQSLEELLFGGL
jgi:hypothetical protein